MQRVALYHCRSRIVTLAGAALTTGAAVVMGVRGYSRSELVFSPAGRDDGGKDHRDGVGSSTSASTPNRNESPEMIPQPARRQPMGAAPRRRRAAPTLVVEEQQEHSQGWLTSAPKVGPDNVEQKSPALVTGAIYPGREDLPALKAPPPISKFSFHQKYRVQQERNYFGQVEVPNNVPKPKLPMWASSLTHPALEKERLVAENWISQDAAGYLSPTSKAALDHWLREWLLAAASTTATTTSSSSSPLAVQLFNENIEVHPRVASFRGVFAKKSIQKGEVAFVVPLRPAAASTAPAVSLRSPLTGIAGAENETTTTTGTTNAAAPAASFGQALHTESLATGAPPGMLLPFSQVLDLLLSMRRSHLDPTPHLLFVEQVYLAMQLAVELEKMEASSEFFSSQDASAPSSSEHPMDMENTTTDNNHPHPHHTVSAAHPAGTPPSQQQQQYEQQPPPQHHEDDPGRAEKIEKSHHHHHHQMNANPRPSSPSWSTYLKLLKDGCTMEEQNGGSAYPRALFDDDHIKELHRSVLEPNTFLEYSDHCMRFRHILRGLHERWWSFYEQQQQHEQQQSRQESTTAFLGREKAKTEPGAAHTTAPLSLARPPSLDSLEWALRTVLSRQRMTPHLRQQVEDFQACAAKAVVMDDDEAQDAFGRAVMRLKWWVYDKVLGVVDRERLTSNEVKDPTALPAIIPLLDCLQHAPGGVANTSITYEWLPECPTREDVSAHLEHHSSASSRASSPEAGGTENSPCFTAPSRETSTTSTGSGNGTLGVTPSQSSSAPDHQPRQSHKKELYAVVRATEDIGEDEELTTLYPKCYSVAYTLYRYGCLPLRRREDDNARMINEK